eukprot:CAMPEP_0114405696 /NCGR_PEP_ID=MMETSP0102-20121206/20572_1 /TAXON_ID=38822 ORGANISM="Pteridomonas danica, Strain PT" /NCGR_SAMPLE_ID=MMETSP0102 /ASSEMBLY_ACC=CAM_ASM_000212 /LENGTH=38 /DNA_ID= /DNA_START= /DNA_END= /DNA_ORIENTATION=
MMSNQMVTIQLDLELETVLEEESHFEIVEKLKMLHHEL